MEHQKRYNLGALADPKEFTEPLEITDLPEADLIKQLQKMLLIRGVEEAIAKLVKKGVAKCPCHLAIGQEAPAVGVAHHLRTSDRAFGTHRSHSHYLAMGGSVEQLINEILGRESGCSKGMGGSMHLLAGEHGFHGSVPIVAGTIPLAVGAALAAKLDGRGDVAVAFFGDGACEEGVFHEALNFASVKKLPVLFIVENNLYSSHLDIQARQPFDSTARFADAHAMQARVVDGNDVVAVSAAANELVAKARQGEGPGFLEAITFRWLGHVGASDDVDVGVRRGMEELAAWKKRDPVARLRQALERRGDITSADYIRWQTDIERMLEMVCESALSSPWPDPSALLDHVYA
jgi:TPP-dependent pyruvate/acetoin dehydrogenase alpha subunit